jgi:hypothetical protein
VQGGRRAETADADDENTGATQPLLFFRPNFPPESSRFRVHLDSSSNKKASPAGTGMRL